VIRMEHGVKTARRTAPRPLAGFHDGIGLALGRSGVTSVIGGTFVYRLSNQLKPDTPPLDGPRARKRELTDCMLRRGICRSADGSASDPDHPPPNPIRLLAARVSADCGRERITERQRRSAALVWSAEVVFSST